MLLNVNILYMCSTFYATYCPLSSLVSEQVSESLGKMAVLKNLWILTYSLYPDFSWTWVEPAKSDKCLWHHILILYLKHSWQTLILIPLQSAEQGPRSHPSNHTPQTTHLAQTIGEMEPVIQTVTVVNHPLYYCAYSSNKGLTGRTPVTRRRHYRILLFKKTHFLTNLI